MTIQEIIDGLEEQRKDRLQLADGDVDSIFAYDAAVLAAAIERLEKVLRAKKEAT